MKVNDWRAQLKYKYLTYISISWQLEEFFDIHLQVPFAHLEELAYGTGKKKEDLYGH